MFYDLYIPISVYAICTHLLLLLLVLLLLFILLQMYYYAMAYKS